ncbi:MAG: hypothetical protein IPM69_01260 [Ignavibacteria bacterium]|nr:hypothetical protein [Ignavibacteria bacterium]
MYKPIMMVSAIFLLLCGCGSSPKPIILQCSLSKSEFNSRAQDSLQTYKFHILEADSVKIQTIRKIEDGLSNRTVYLTLTNDSTTNEWSMIVRTIVTYHGESNEYYMDEKPRFSNDFRRDFRPVLTAIRSMCAPPPKKKKKKL